MSRKNKNQNQGTAIWIDEVGAIVPRTFQILKKEKKDGKNILTIDFGNNETYNIRSDFIRTKRCIIYKCMDGKIKVQNPNEWRKINLAAKGIKTIRFNLQNFGIQEGKAATRRWTLPPALIKKLMPLFKLLVVGVSLCVIVYLSWKAGTIIFDSSTAARLANCNNLIPNIVNITLGK